MFALPRRRHLRPKVGGSARPERGSATKIVRIVVSVIVAGVVVFATAACGQSSLADTDKPIREGRRVNEAEAAAIDARDRKRAAGDQTDRPRLLVVGDNSLANVGRSIVSNKDDLAVEARSRFTEGCSLLPFGPSRSSLGLVDQPPDQCSPAATWAPAVLTAFDPTVVLIALRVPDDHDFELVDGWHAICDPPFSLWYSAELGAAIDALGADGARVAVALDAGSGPGDRCIAAAVDTAVAGRATLVDFKTSIPQLVQSALGP